MTHLVVTASAEEKRHLERESYGRAVPQWSMRNLEYQARSQDYRATELVE